MRWRALRGLRGRLTAALVLTGLLTFAVSATVLVVPLDRRLRADSLESLTQTALAARPAFADLPARDVRAGAGPLRRTLARLGRQTGAEVAAIDSTGHVLAATGVAPRERFGDAVRAVNEDRVRRGVVTLVGDGEPEARVAVPVEAGGVRFALTLRRSLESTTSANGVVTRGLLIGGVVGLVLAVLVGAVLARRLVRRLNGLREAALRLAAVGPAAEIRPDSIPDEVGDLGRAFAVMQERLREQEHARRAFVATASHEMRTPVASLRLMLEFLAEDLGQDDPDIADARHRVRTALTQAERLGGLADDLLDLSRLDARLPLRSELVELGELARAVAGEFQVSAVDAGVTLDVPEGGGRWVIGDPGGIAQILRILLDNALHHAPPGSTVGVALERAGEAVTVRVTDAGTGVAAEDRERIFERFERGNGSDGHPGVGLGLAIGRELADRMDGALELAVAETGGGGAVFVLTLVAAPAGDADPEPAPTSR